MNYSISNIAWAPEQDRKVYAMMQSHDFTGLEIAPTRIIPKAPYDCIEQATAWSAELKARYGFSIPSMQSIWYGRTERIFGYQEERQKLLDYTRKAIDFAAAIGCRNLVFGCPRNRSIKNEDQIPEAIPFFREIGDYAFGKGAVVGFEANPVIYNTNYMTDTQSALKLVRQVNSKGFLLNLDLGTMIFNRERVSDLSGFEDCISHVHISEPGLILPEKRMLHYELAEFFHSFSYQGFISIEVSRQDDITVLDNLMAYVRKVFV